VTSAKLRKIFIDFFEKRNHTKHAPSSLVPLDDPSVLFTTAGMQQFKQFYTNPDKSKSKRLVTIQPCFRTSDIDEVGDDTHLTFFEMLGNFSFGYTEANRSKSKEKNQENTSYFKEDAIQWAWDFVTSTQGLGIDPARIEVSVFRGEKNIPLDDESIRIWRKIGVPNEKIKLGTREDNFWGPTGLEGPCGPTTELYVDGIEIWNLVFNEYYQDADGNLIPAQYKGVDTGMGLERLLAVLNGKKTVFETELYFDLIEKLRPLGLAKEKERIIADHVKGIIFLINENLEPGNLGREYILRRLLRRVMIIEGVYAQLLALCNLVFEMYQTQYRFNPGVQERLTSILEREWIQFSKTLEKGKVYISKLNTTRLSGEEAFRIYSTYGIPIDAQKDLLGDATVVDSAGFEREYLASFEAHRSVSRAGVAQKFGGHGLITKGGEISSDLSPQEYEKALRNHTATHLLHAALRAVLGEYVQQKGSDVAPERLRFDFTYERALTEEEKKRVEAWVNARIKEDVPVNFTQMDKGDALRSGALAFFPERYPQKCKVYTIGDQGHQISQELCGGPHVTHTSEIGHFAITSEKSSSAGVRRIKAVTSNQY
jgi:alanyl-tRNA synthetase